MSTALDITNAFLADILAKLQNTITPPTADETSNLLNQYQTLTQLIRDGYQWTAEDLDDLPTLIRNETKILLDNEILNFQTTSEDFKNTLASDIQVQLDSVLITMPVLQKYNLDHCSSLSNVDLNTFSETGFFRISNAVNGPYSSSWCFLLSLTHNDRWGRQLFFNFYDSKVFVRNYVDSSGVRSNQPWKEFTLI